jgi:phage-related minor tail protein
MPGAVTVGQLIVNLSANTADLKSDLAGTTATVKQSAQEMTNAWAGVTTSTGNVNAAGKALIATLKEQIATFGMTDQQLIQYKANLAGVGGEVQALNARLTGMKDAASAYGEEAKKAGAHTEQFSLSTAGARRELIVLAHEMSQGNYSKFGGSLLVLAERTNAASLLFSAAGLTLGALAAVIGLTGYELYKMHSEIDEFNKSLQLTGNFAGVTRDSLNSMSTSIQSSATGGVRKATEVLEGLAATGHFTSGAMLATGESALQFARLTGKSSEDVVKFFDGMSNGVTAWAETANKSYHFLSAAQYEHIATLEKEGNSQQAVILAMNLMNAGLDENAKHLSYWQKNAQGWTMILDAAGESMRKFAFPTVNEEIEKESTKLAKLREKFARIGPGIGGGDQIQADIVKQVKIVNDLMTQAVRERVAADQKSEQDLANLRAVAAQKDLDQIKTGLKTRDELRADAEAKIRKDAEIINANAMSNGKQIVETADDVARLVAASNAKYADKAVDDRAAQLNYALELEKANFQEQTGLYNERIKQLELYHSKFGLSDGAFYSGREAARAEYLQAAAAAYDKESDLVANFDNKNSKEEADSNRTLQKMFADYQKFVADMNGVASLDGANVLAAEQKAYDDMIAALDKAGQTSLKSIDDQIAKEKKHALEIGHTKEQIDRLMQAQQDAATADLESQSKAIEDLLKQQDLNGIARGIYEEQLVQINAQIAARKELAGILGSNAVLQADADAAKKATEEWSRANKKIGDDLASAIVDGGGHGVKKLVRDMELAFAKAVLQPILSPVTGAISSFLNPNAAQAQGGAGSGILGLASSASSANSLYKGASTAGNALFGSGSGTVASWLAGSSSVAPTSVAAANFAGAAGGDAIGTLASFEGWTTAASAAGAEAGAAAGASAAVAAGAAEAGAGAAGAGAVAVGGADAAAGTAAGFGPWGWAAAAAILAYVALSGDGPEQNTHLKFANDNAAGNISINERGNEGKTDAYIAGSGTSSLGTFGVASTLWTPAESETVQSFIKTVSQTDDALAQFMTTSEKASAAANLVGKTYTAQTGPEGSNQNANGQLDYVFAQRINNILDGVEPGLSALEAGFKGTSSELATEAEALLKYRAALKDSGEAVFGVKVTLQDIAALKLPTENTSAALIRVAGEFTSTNAVAQLFGKTGAEAFGAVGLASEAARAQLVLAAGGIDALASQTASFANNYLSDAEKAAAVMKPIAEQLSVLGYTGITTKDQFKQLVEGLDLSTAAGAKQYAALMQLQDGFAQAAAATEATAAASVQAAQDAQAAAANLAGQQADLQGQIYDMTHTAVEATARQRQVELDAMAASLRPLKERIYALTDERAAADAAATAAQAAAAADQAAADAIAKAQASAAAATQSFGNALADSITKAHDAAKAFRALNDALLIGDSSTLSPEQKYAEAKRQFDTADASGLQSAEKAFLDASKAWFGGSAGYAADFAAVLARNSSEAASQDATAAAIPGIWKNFMASVSGLNGSHANGLDYVPFDGYRAELHKGERVQTAAAVRNGDAAAQETNSLLREVLTELRADKTQRGAVADATLNKLGSVVDKLDDTKRVLAKATA